MKSEEVRMFSNCFRALAMVIAVGGAIPSFGEILLADPTLFRDGDRWVLAGTENGFTDAGLPYAGEGLNGTGHGDAFVGPDGAVWYLFHAHHSSIRVSPRRTGVIRLVETVGDDGIPRYQADEKTMRLL